MELKGKVYVAGHRGMVGSAIVRQLTRKGITEIIGKTSAELDLRNQALVEAFFEAYRPDYVFLAAAKVGGIYANNVYRAEFLYDNIMIATNVIHAAWKYKVKKLLFLGSSCIYPKFAPQPIREEFLLTGPLEPTNEPYAIAKIAGLKLCENYRRQYGCNFFAVMPTNLYGPNDNYELESAHVLPALIRKFHEARTKGLKQVVVWGDGSPLREFMHVDDLAKACVFLMENYEEAEIINVGTGQEISIKDLALLIKKIVGFEGEIVFDTEKPNGTPRKLLDCSRLQAMGFFPEIPLERGIREVYHEYVSNLSHK
ncbi:MAG: GDP-L-fucose synthase [Bacteroidia bacterium]|nr:GDP-L-fucose synthase [Bacteroidia bacterium]MDW8157420.1 GDP-L-fucose synthase [Bacteroidia bacterium]